MRIVRRFVVLFVTASILALGPSPANAAESPYGANNWGCRPSATHPVPVVLVHGTFGNQKQFDLVSYWLTYFGYCTYALDYGNSATGDIPTSASQLRSFVDKVRAYTGSPKVSLVGHSQGGTMARYYVKFLGGAAKVDDLVGLAPSNHGAPLAPWLVPYLPYCAACSQQVTGSSFLTTLNAGDETPGDVAYTNVVTVYDQVVTPYTSSYLSGPNTANVRVQDYCPKGTPDHASILKDATAIQIVLNALGRPGPATAFAAYC